MTLKINQKIMAIMAVFFLISLVMFAATLIITGQQANDGLVINQAGRQRMLSQKMTKECLGYLYFSEINDVSELDRIKTDLANSMAVFEATLEALINSGSAPLTLDPNGASEYLPAASGAAAGQLKEVRTLWVTFKGAVQRVISEKKAEDVRLVMKSNLQLLASMSKAVGIMQAQAESKVKRLVLTQAVCMVAGLLVVVLAVLWSKAKIVSPIKSGVAFAEKLAAGDLTGNIKLDQEDEIGQLAGALSQMSGNLNGMIRQISEAVGTLASSSNQMSSVSGQMATGAERTVAKSNTVAAAAEEMSSNMGSIAAAMEQAFTNVKTVAASSGEISTSIGKVTKNTAQAKEVALRAVHQTESASVRVNELGKAAEEIGMVTATIKAISDKTNLLALNATIEAARAGEAGKGFAVVANEIKALATQTAEATEDIAARLKGIQSSTGHTVTEIEEVSGVISQVADIVAGISEELDQQHAATTEISENVNQAAQGLDEININISQSSQAVGQVSREIIEVNDGANDFSTSSAQIQQSASELNRLATKLTEMVGRFTI